MVLFHTDDAALCASANGGAIAAWEAGLARSMSLMAPCPGLPEMAVWLRAHREVDAGVHVTLTSEFPEFRWKPLSAPAAAPGLCAGDGGFHPDTRSLIAHAAADEVEREIRAQVRAVQDAGVTVGHMDCHMASVYAHREFCARFLAVGVELGIPVLLEGGGLSRRARLRHDARRVLRHLRAKANADFPLPPGDLVEHAWQAGQPVVDWIYADTYVWPAGEKVARMAALPRQLRPGITVVLLHCAVPGEDFGKLGSTGAGRCADTEAMISPALREAVTEAGVHCTTWKELSERRKAITSRSD